MQPVPHSHEQRLSIAAAITDGARAKYGTELVAVGIFGSTAKGLDHPLSDVELHAVVNTPEYEEYFEWFEHGIKKSVDVLGVETIRRKASRVEFNWPLTASEFANVQPTYDPGGFLPEVREMCLSQPQAKFDAAIRDVIVGNLVEYVAKVEVAGDSRVWMTLEVAQCACWLAGLTHRHLYGGSATVFREALQLTDQPEGMDRLLRIAIDGNLVDPDLCRATVRSYWHGVLNWAHGRIDLRLESPFK